MDSLKQQATAKGRDLYKAPRAGFEPATNRLTVDRSTAELPRIERLNLTLIPSDRQVGLSV